MSKTIHFITYANNKYEKAKQRLVSEAKEFGEFATIKGYGPEDLPDDFRTKFDKILKLPRGGGYWIWKTAIIKENMLKMKEGDFLLYMDAGCKLNSAGKQRFYEYIDILNKSEYGILSIQMSGNLPMRTDVLQQEKIWTTTQTFDYFGVSLDSEIAKSGQYLGGIFIIQKCAHSDFIIEKYNNTLYRAPLLFTDFHNKLKQQPEFRDHRHDQSVFSLIRKLHGSAVIDGDESWMPPFGTGISLKYPFWAARLRK